MTRYRITPKRSEEAKRNLKVDPRRIPEWEAELKSIYDCFLRFNISEIVTAATFIEEIRKGLFFYTGPTRSEEEKEKERLGQWKNTLTVDKLMRTSGDYNVPEWFTEGMVGKYQKESTVYSIQSTLKKYNDYLAKSKVNGVTNSLWVSLFTKKVNVEDVQKWEIEHTKYLALSHEIPKIENALRLLSDVYSESIKYATRVKQIEERLSTAEEKKGALERFDAKHGKAFAKAAAADNQTRSRATSLKRIVKKTKNCPYCEANLGASPHLDHIYPVSKGGLSIVENLVWCCSICNGLKTDKGLIQFLKERGLPIEQTLTRLLSIGKHV